MSGHSFKNTTGARRDKGGSSNPGLVSQPRAGDGHESNVQKQLSGERKGSLAEHRLKAAGGQQQSSLSAVNFEKAKLETGESRLPRSEERTGSNVHRKIEEQRLLARRIRYRDRDHKAARRYTHSNHYLRDPVDAITGEVIWDGQDFVLPGPIRLQWVRHYGSQNEYQGVCGRGWETPGDVRLVFKRDGTVLFHDGSGAPSVFKSLPAQTGVTIIEPIDGRSLLKEEEYYIVRGQDGRAFYFPLPKSSVDAIKLERVADRFGNSVQYFWDANGLREIRDSGGCRIEVLSRQGRIESMTLIYPGEPARNLVRYSYDDHGNLTAAYDALAVPYRYAYRDNLLVRHTNRNGLSFYYEYDQYVSEGRCTYTHGDDGLYEGWFVYHEDQKLVEAIGSLGTTTFLYDERYLVLAETNPLGEVAKFEYDEAGRTTAVIDPDGHRTEYTYDESGNVVKLTRPDGSTLTTEYDVFGNPSRIIDPNGAEWKQEWNEKKQLVREISPLGAIAQYHYDERGQLIEYRDALGNKTGFAFDNYGNLIGLTDVQGNTIQYIYDCLGNITTRSSSLRPTSSYQYDPKGRLTKALLPGGTTIACEYDAEDNLIAYQDQNGAVTRMEYCGVNELKRRIQPDGRMVEYEYNKEEQLIAVINQRGERYELRRDAAGRITEEIDYWGQSRRYSYSAAGHLRESIDPLGRVIRYQTDPLGRVLQKVTPPLPGFTNSESESFQYDLNGNLIACANGEIRVQRKFDPEGKLAEEQQGQDFKVIYSYDPAGNRLSRTTALENGETTLTRTVKYCYDKSGRATGIRVGDHQPVSITRNAIGQVIEEELGSQIRRSSQYNESGHLVRQTVGANTGLLFEQEYCYDRVGNLTEKRDSVLGTDKFSYDPLGRIISRIDPLGGIQEFLYDPAGDRLTTRLTEEKTDDGESSWNRTGEFEDLTYHFDRAGNLLKRAGVKEETSFVWDANQRLLESDAGGETVCYRYDPLGRRISKQTKDTTVRFFWDGDALLGEIRLENRGDGGAGTDGDLVGTRRREWVYYPGSFEPLALVQKEGLTGAGDTTQAADEIYYYVNDPNAYPTRLLSESGRIVWAAQYDPWGKVKQYQVREMDQPLRLQGQYFDRETGLHYNRLRYYEPHIGAFISQDPLGLVPGINPYQYAVNIWSWTDPLGLCKQRGRPANGSHGQAVSIASDFITDKRTIGHSSLAKDFYSVPNHSGGRVYVSLIPISQKDFEGLVNGVNAKGNITVLTGTHGDLDGNLIPEVDFFKEDFASWGKKHGIDVIDITKMNDSQIANVLNSPGRTICAWCYSERSKAVLDGLGFTP